ncbi:MAG: amidohydrolase family protein [Fodinibius sp.]|nr:amidohydrolase family protein [Fodinibius sp.]
MRKLFSLLSLLFFLGISTFVSAQATYIHCGNLIDGVNDEVQSQKTVIIKGSTIQAIEDGYTDVPSDADYIDLKDQTVLPGLIDMHVHIESETSPNDYIKQFTLNEADIAYNAIGYANTTLMSGFTTVRDVGGTGVNISLRNAIDAGKVDGPRIFTSGKSIATTGGHADPTNGWKDDIEGIPVPSRV